MRVFDVRLFALPPNVAVGAVRCFGSATARAPLKDQKKNLASATKAMKSTRLYKALLREFGKDVSSAAGGKNPGTTMVNEYRRVQQKSKSLDHELNKAVGALLEEALKKELPSLTVTAEKQALDGSSMIPDVLVTREQGDDIRIVCLEITWRSTDKGVEREFEDGQNTLSERHIKKYLLGKVIEYVKDHEK